jgi:hypothetical protein
MDRSVYIVSPSDECAYTTLHFHMPIYDLIQMEETAPPDRAARLLLVPAHDGHPSREVRQLNEGERPGDGPQHRHNEHHGPVFVDTPAQSFPSSLCPWQPFLNPSARSILPPGMV